MEWRIPFSAVFQKDLKGGEKLSFAVRPGFKCESSTDLPRVNLPDPQHLTGLLGVKEDLTISTCL